MIRLLLVSILAASGTSDAFGVTVQPLSVASRHAELTLFVKDEAQVMDTLLATAEGAGGYLKLRRPSKLIVRIPPAALDNFLKQAESLGVVGERNLRTEDLVTAKTRTQAELASREDMLKQYLTTLESTATRDDLTEIQGATSGLIQEIETKRGLLRTMDHDSRYALVDVSFEKRDRTPLRVSRQTSFAWLRTVDVRSLLRDFEGDHP